NIPRQVARLVERILSGLGKRQFGLDRSANLGNWGKPSTQLLGAGADGAQEDKWSALLLGEQRVQQLDRLHLRCLLLNCDALRQFERPAHSRGVNVPHEIPSPPKSTSA